MNMGNALEAPREGEWGYRIRFEDFDRIKTAGFDGVRIPVRWDVHTGPAPDFTINSAHFARVDGVVDYALSAGLGVVLDVHHYLPIMKNPEGEADRFTAIWRQISARYAGRSDKLIFELLNEPQGDVMTPAAVEALYTRALAEIRRTNPTRLVIAGGPRWNTMEGLKGWSPPAGDKNLAVTVHYYAPFNFTYQDAEFLNPAPKFGRRWGTTSDIAALRRDAETIARWGRDQGFTIFMGEFGVNDHQTLDQRALWTREARMAWDANQIAWCHWDYAGAFETFDQKREAWISPVLDALVR